MPSINKQRNIRNSSRRRHYHERNHQLNREDALKTELITTTQKTQRNIERIIWGFTNWQLTKWQRAGQPMDLESVQLFARMKKE